MPRFRLASYFALLIAGPASLAASGRRDVDVALPPGSPIEWLQDVPTQPSSDYRSRVPTRSGGVGSTVTSDTPMRIKYGSLFSIFRVTTQDLPQHLQWTGAMPLGTSTPTGAAKGTPTGDAGPAVKIEYPPQMTEDQFWMAVVIFLRRLLHPAEVSNSEALQYLIYLGEPSLVAANAAKGERSLASLIDGVNRSIAPMPATPPTMVPVPKAGEGMIYRLTFEDLVTDFPFGVGLKWAGRISKLGTEATDAAIAMSRSGHLFLRRNATLFLGTLGSPSALERLVELLKKDQDGVVRVRALEALARKKHTPIVEYLVEEMKKTDAKNWKVFYIYALGKICSPGPAADVLAEMKKHNDCDVNLTGLTALARMSCGNDAKIAKEVRQYAGQALADDPPAPPYQPVAPDPPNWRYEVIKQLSLICGASAGDGSCVSKLGDLIKEGGSRRGFGRDARFRSTKGLLARFHKSVVHVLIETLARSEAGRALLTEIAKDAQEDQQLRAYALFNLAMADPQTIDLVKDVLDLEVPDVCEVGLMYLRMRNAKAGAEPAKKLIAKYAPTLTPDKKYVIALALELLGLAGESSVPTLTDIIRREKESRTAPPPPPPKPEPGKYGTGQAQEQQVYSAPAPLLEYAVIELGRTRDAGAAGIIIAQILSDAKAPARAEACIALGAVGTPEAIDALVKALEDPDGWVRFMAYRSLKEISGENHFCDWIYDSAATRKGMVIKYAQWARSMKGEAAKDPEEPKK